jgi:Cdc6-like AAA superfamily ATPase
VGSGKTVLSSVFIDHLQSKYASAGFVVTYIYCDLQDSTAQTLENLTGSLLRQLVESCPKMPNEIFESYMKHKKGKTPLSAPEVIVLCQGLRESFTRIYMIADARDECSYGQSGSMKMLAFESALQELSKPKNPSECKVQLLVTSRFSPQPVTESPFCRASG